MLNRLAQFVMIACLVTATLPMGIAAAMPGGCPMIGLQAAETGFSHTACDHCPLPTPIEPASHTDQPMSGANGAPSVMTCCCVVAAFVDTGADPAALSTPAVDRVVDYDRTAINFESQPPSPPPRVAP